MSDLVSIIMPCYNSSRFIEVCVNSVVAQTYINWELLIVDDCSRDNSQQLISNLCESDHRIKPVFLDDNIGSAGARNIAIKKAKGKYIAFLDSDDLWAPNKLESQVLFMKENNISFSFTSYQPISEDGRQKYKIIRACRRINYYSYLKNTIIGCLTVVIDKEQIGNVEFPDLRSSQDMALWLIILRRGFDAFGLDENLSYYRIVSDSNTSNKLKAAYGVWNVYRKVENIGFLYSLWYFMHYLINALKKRI